MGRIVDVSPPQESPPLKNPIIYTPPKINIEPENDGLEDDFSFSRGVFSGSMLIFRGCIILFWGVGSPSNPLFSPTGPLQEPLVLKLLRHIACRCYPPSLGTSRFQGSFQEIFLSRKLTRESWQTTKF